MRAFRLTAIIPGRPPLARRLDSPIVGRAREIGALRAAFEEAVARQSLRTALVLGPAGVGKSRLGAELRAFLHGRATVLNVRCLPFGQEITFGPVADLMRQAAGLAANEPPEAARTRIETLLQGEPDAGTIADRVLTLVGLSGASAPPEETFWAVRRVLEALARRRPVVVEFDDLHWAPPIFLDLLEHLLERAEAVPVLLVLVGRPELLEARPTWGDRASLLSLQPLTDDECASLITSLLGEATLAPAAMRRITEGAEGNPLFVEEMLAMLIDEGLLRRDEGQWVPAQDLSRLSVPPTIDALLTARLDQLADPERRVLEIAAVAGREFGRNAVAEVAPNGVRGRLDVHLAGLADKDFIRSQNVPLSTDERFRFRHVLIRDAVYAGIPKKARAHLHERFADWLEHSAEEPLLGDEEIVGYHLEQAYGYRAELGPVSASEAQLASRASRHLAAAGRRVLGRGDVAAAVGLLTRATSLAVGTDGVRPAALADLGVALMEAGRLQDAEKVLTDALAASALEESGPAGILAGVLLAWVRWFTDPEGKAGDSRREAERAITVFDEIGDDRGLAKAWRLLGDVHWTECRYGDSERAWTRALHHARRADDGREERQLLGSLATASFHGPTPVPIAISTCEEILRRAGGNRTVEARAGRSLAGLLAMRGQFGEATASLDRAEAIFQDLGQQIELGANQMAGAVELLAGNARAAERRLRAGYEILDRIGERSYLPSVAAMLAAAVYLQGRWEEAAELAETSRRHSSSDDVDAQVMWRGTLAKVLARRGEADRAAALAREGVALAATTDALDMHATALMDLAEVLRLGGRPRDALPVLEDATRIYERKGNVVSARLARRSLQALSTPSG